MLLEQGSHRWSSLLRAAVIIVVQAVELSPQHVVHQLVEVFAATSGLKRSLVTQLATLVVVFRVRVDIVGRFGGCLAGFVQQQQTVEGRIVGFRAGTAAIDRRANVHRFLGRVGMRRQPAVHGGLCLGS